MYCFFMYRKYGIPQRAMDGGADIYMAPRPGLEPGTNGLTVELTNRLFRGNSKNFKGIFDSNPPSHSRSEPIPKFTYDLLSKLNPNLWLQISRKPALARNYARPNYEPNPNRFRNRDCNFFADRSCPDSPSLRGGAGPVGQRPSLPEISHRRTLRGTLGQTGWGGVLRVSAMPH